MADASYDAVIIGGGQHGLILGCYLQNASMTSVVLERQHELGGGLCTDEVPLPGFLANPCAHWTRFYSHPIYHDFNLRDKGLQYIFPEGGAGVVLDNGTCIVGYTAYRVVDAATGRSEFSPQSAERTIAEIARFSQRDAETCRRFIEEWDRKWQEAFWQHYFTPPDPWGVKNPIERALDDGEQGVIEPVHQFMPVSRLAYDLFESPEMRVHFLRGAQVSTALYFDAVVGIDQLVGILSLVLALRAPSIVIGGTHTITHALQRAFSEMGGNSLFTTRLTR